MRRTILALCALAAIFAPEAAMAEPRHAIAIQGEPALPDNFTHFPYADPDAPKGGDVTYCVIGSFDNLNPFILKSLRTTARGIIDTIYGNLVFEPLMQRNAAEPFSLYGLLAESIDITPDRRVATFNLNPKAKWSDGQPVTPEDVLFTYEVYTEKGRPPYSDRMKRIEKLEKTGPLSVRFTFNDKADREFPLIVAMTPILPKHAFDKDTFDQTTLKPLIGSGPYTIDKVVPGDRIIYKRNPDYWARDLPSKRGFDNFDRVDIEYFLNDNAQFEAFKKGICSVYAEADPVKLKRDFDFPALKDGRVTIGEFKLGIPPVVTGFLFNTRLPKFADVRVRRALGMLYDFEWINRNMFDSQFERTASYWQDSELSALGRPASDKEKALLAPFPDAVPADIMDGTWRPAVTDGSGRDRKVLKAALDLLKIGRLFAGRHQAARSERPAILVRDSDGLGKRAAAGRRLPADAGQDRHRHDDPRAGSRPDPDAQAAFRFRHADWRHRLHRHLVSGHRADISLGVGVGQCRGLVQSRRRRQPGDRRRHRGDAQRPRQGGFRRRRAGAGPAADRRRLHGADAVQSQAVSCLLDLSGPPCRDLALRLPVAGVVAET